MGTLGFYGYSAIPATLFMLMAVLAWWRASQGQKGWTWVSGIIAGLTGFYRHDFGAYLGLALVIWTLLVRPYGSWKENFKAITILITMCLTTILLLFSHTLFNVPFALLWERLITYPT